MKPFLLSILAAGVIVLLLALSISPPRAAPGGPLLLHAGAGLRVPIDAAVGRYRAETGRDVHVQFGSSGSLLSGLEVALRGDLYLPGEEEYLEIARTKGLVAEIIPIAWQRPVVAVPRGNPKGIRALADLLREDVRVGLANDQAAVGRSARRALEAAGLWDRLAPRIRTFKPAAGDVANDVALGAVDAGIVWDAIVRQHGELEAVDAPELARERCGVAVGVLRSAPSSAAALHFARYLSAPDRGLEAFAASGYETREGDAWESRPRLVLFSGGVNRLAIEATVSEFEAREGVSVERIYNGCGILVAEMRTLAGKPGFPDAYFACDRPFLRDVAPLFGDPLDLSRTRMVILAAPGNPHAIRGLEDLGRSGLRLGVADARASALGALLERILREEGLLEAVERNVRTRTPTADLLVNQMRTGSLDAAVVYAANASQVGGVLEVIPIAAPGAEAVQPFAASRATRHPRLVGRLLDALRAAASRQRFLETGFDWLAGEAVGP